MPMDAYAIAYLRVYCCNIGNNTRQNTRQNTNEYQRILTQISIVCRRRVQAIG